MLAGGGNNPDVRDDSLLVDKGQQRKEKETLMSMKKWRIGFTVAIAFGLLSAGASIADGFRLTTFIAVLCTSLATHLGAYLMKHPVEEISEVNSASKTKTETENEQ